MKNLITSVFLILIFSFKINAQNKVASNDKVTSIDFSFSKKKKAKKDENYIRLDVDKRKIARKESSKILNKKERYVIVSSAIKYMDMLYWKIRTNINGRTKFYVFRSDVSFKSITKKECRLEPLLELAQNF